MIFQVKFRETPLGKNELLSIFGGSILYNRDQNHKLNATHAAHQEIH